jgi:hypothetical protein
MIEFKGNISDKCKKYIWNRETKIVSLSCIILSLIFSGAVIVVAIKVNLIVLLFLLLAIGFAVLGSIPQKGIDERIPQSVSIENNEILFVSETNSKSHSVSDVKKVIDMGEWYVIDLYFPNKNLYCVCQKDLLTEGSAEEFETLFARRLVRNSK